MNKNVAVHGSYYGFNFGDTLLCRLGVEWVRAANPALNVNLPYANEANLKLCRADTRGFFGFLKSDALIFVGGGHFGEPKHGKHIWSLRNYLRHVTLGEIARLRGIPILIVGVEFGPITNLLLRWRIVKLFNAAQTVVVRNEESAKFLKQYGYKGKPIVAADAVVSLQRKAKNKTGRKVRKVVVHLTEIDSPKGKLVLNGLIRFFAKHPDLEVTALTDVKPKYPNQPVAQVLVARQLAAVIPGAKVWEHTGEPNDVIEVLADADLIITNKLHVGITGVTVGTQVIAFPHHQKTMRFHKQIGRAHWCVPLSEVTPESAERLMNAWYKNGGESLEALAKLAAEAPYQRLVKAFIGMVYSNQ